MTHASAHHDRSSSLAPAGASAPVFGEPWEARAFALALTLSQSGQFQWNEFRDRLIAEIARADAAAVRDLDIAGAESGPYYECWLAALETLLRARELITGEEIERRAAAIAASPPVSTKAKSRGPIKIA